MDEEILLESEIRSTTTSVELALDHLYKKMNARTCEISRRLMRNTATLLKANMETLYDEHGAPLFHHVAGEGVTFFRCTPTIVQVRTGEERCCVELPIWTGANLTIPAFMQPTNRRISNSCTPRVCNHYNVPIYNVGSNTSPNWIRLTSTGRITKATPPRSFTPKSSNKNEQIVVGESSIFSRQQKVEFQKLSLVKDAREIVTAEMVHRMFPPTSMNALSDVIDSPSFSTQDFISNQLQQVFLPFPLSLIHFLPRWLLVTSVTIIGLLLIKVFMDPTIAVCNLCRASSLSIVEQLTTISTPTVSIFRKHQREASLELGGKVSLEEMIQNQDTRFEVVEKEVRQVFNTQVKLQTTMREIEARLDAETQNLSEIKRKDQ